MHSRPQSKFFLRDPTLETSGAKGIAKFGEDTLRLRRHERDRFRTESAWLQPERVISYSLRCEVTAASKAALGGAGLAIAGSLAPWVDLGFVSVSGIEGDGVISLGAAVLGGLPFAVEALGGREAGGSGAFLGIAGGIFAVFVTVYDLLSVGSPAWGLWIAALGSLALLIGSAICAKEARSASREREGGPG